MKRLLPCLLALTLLLAPALCVPAAAADSLPVEIDVFYRQLSPAGQALFDRLNTKESLAKFRSGEPIDLSVSGAYRSDEDLQQQVQACFTASAEAYAAVLQCYPEIFWTKSCGISGTYTYGGGGYTLSMYLTPKFEANWAVGGRDVYADEAAVNAAVQALGAEAILQGGPWSQLKYVHDWLTTHNVYNDAAAAGSNPADYLPWTPLAALTDESRPVCEGYARAFKMLCDELGYPCLYVAGYADGPHAWNQVQVGGKWYAVDVTFDDPSIAGVTSAVSGQENQKYFLVGEETLLDGYHIFSDDHIPLGNLTDAFSFTYPALAADALDPGFSWAPDRPGWDEPDGPEQPEPDGPGPAVFADVDDLAYYAPAVNWAVALGVTKGTGADAAGNPLFSPADTVTRGQAVTFLWRSMGEPEPETAENPFWDVSETDYSYKAVLWAVENGITNGTGADAEGHNCFSPGDTVKRGQMLTFLWRTQGEPGKTGDYEGKQWYSDAEAWAGGTGVADGTAEAYSTAADCPRSDVVYYLYHAALLMAG